MSRRVRAGSSRPTSPPRRRRTDLAALGGGRPGRAARPASPGSGRASRTAGVDAYFGVRREHMRYLTGLRPRRRRGEGRRQLRPVRGERRRGRRPRRFALHDPGAPRGAGRAASFEAYHDLPSRWPELMASVGARRVAVEAGFVSHAIWERLAAAAPDVELVAVEGWVEADRAVKEPAEIERDRGGLRRRGPGARGAAAGDPAGRHRGRPRAPARVADADRRRRGARLRRRVPVGPGGGAAARRAGRPAGAATGRSSCSTSGRRSRATGAT